MDANNVSFFLQCNRDLKIVKNFWHQPIFLISPLQKNLRQLFVKNNHGRLEDKITKAFLSENRMIWDEPYQIISPKVEVVLCMFAMGEKILVYGIYRDEFKEEYPAHTLRDSVYRFMKLIHSTDTTLMSNDVEIIHKQFDEIQQLNNQLMNVQRSLSKSNSKLNELNLELNNRLVKDELTGLVSRYQYREEIEMTIAKDPDKLGVFIFLDLDHFKEVNDIYGHRTGDEFLKGFGQRLKDLPFDNFIAIRISGDEFGLYIHGLSHVQEEVYRQIWDKIHIHALEKPILIGSQEHEVLCSGGMAVYGLHTRNFFDLIEYADFAMYEAKTSKGHVFRVFEKERYIKKKILVR